VTGAAARAGEQEGAGIAAGREPAANRGVQLSEQPAVGVALDGDAQGDKAGRPGQPERFDFCDHEAELVLQGLADGVPACPADVQVGAAPSAVGDREDLAGREPTKAQ
jgi:hypothetical protein